MALLKLKSSLKTLPHFKKFKLFFPAALNHHYVQESFIQVSVVDSAFAFAFDSAYAYFPTAALNYPSSYIQSSKIWANSSTLTTFKKA